MLSCSVTIRWLYPQHTLFDPSMAHGIGSRLVASTERKFGHLAIPGILRWVAGFQLIVFVISVIDPNYMNVLAFDRDAIFSGQVWRLFSYLVFPQTSSMIWILISVMFLWFIGNGLEAAWGAFRVNLYLAAILLCLTSIGLLIPGFAGNGGFLSLLVFHNLFFAFASLYPNQQILLMLIIPIKIKYLAWVGAGILMLFFLQAPILGPFILACLTPYFLVFVPDFIHNWRHRSKVADRRQRFQSETRLPEGEAFHTCEECGINDLVDPDIEFRVADDGEEYCAPCLERMQEGEPSTNQ